MKKRVNITIDEELDEELDEYCKENHCTKSGILGLAATQYLEAQKMIPTLKSQLEELTEKLGQLKIK